MERNFKTVISGAKFWDFETAGVFTGPYIKEVLRENDVLETGETVAREGNRKGDVMGFLFNVDETDEQTIIGNSHQIRKGLEGAKEGDFYRITFKDKVQNAKGKPVNIFKVEKAD